MNDNLIENKQPHVGNQIMSLLDIVRLVLGFIIKKWLIIIGFGLLGVAVGFLSYHYGQKKYTSELVGYCNILDDDQVVSLVADLKRMMVEGDNTSFAKKMHITEATAILIDQIDAKNSTQINLNKTEDELKTLRDFAFEATVLDKRIFDTLQVALPKFLADNAYAGLRLRKRKDGLMADLTRIDMELKYLDSVKTEFTRMATRPGSTMMLPDLSELSMKAYTLTVEKSKISEDLELMHTDMVVVKPFTKFSKQSTPRLGKSLIYYTVIFVLIGFVIALGPILKQELIKK